MTADIWLYILNLRTKQKNHPKYQKTKQNKAKQTNICSKQILIIF